MSRALLCFVLILAACARNADVRTVPEPLHEPAEPHVAVEPASFVEPSGATLGEWTLRPLGRGNVQGMAVVDGDLLFILGTDGGNARIGRHSESEPPWTFEPIDAGATAIGANIATDGTSTFVSVARCDFMAMRCALAVGTLEGSFEVAVDACGMSSLRHALVVTSSGQPALVNSCRGDTRLTVRDGGAWSDRVLHERATWVVDAAVDSSGVVFAMGSWSVWRVDVDGVEGDVMPEGSDPSAIAACRGRVWAAFEVDGEDGTEVQAGPWDGDDWSLETIPSTVLGTTKIAFDEECRPFVSVANEVFARSGEGFRGGAISTLGNVHALIVHEGELYAGIDDGGDVSVATAAIVPE